MFGFLEILRKLEGKENRKQKKKERKKKRKVKMTDQIK